MQADKLLRHTLNFHMFTKLNIYWAYPCNTYTKENRLTSSVIHNPTEVQPEMLQNAKQRQALVK